MAQIARFYEAMAPRMAEALDHLGQYDGQRLPPAEQTLLYLAFGYAEAAIAVEIFRAPGVPDVPCPSGTTVCREMYRPI